MPPAPDMANCEEKTWTRALELERARMDEQGKKKAWAKRVNPCPFIRAEEAMRLPTSLVKLAYPPSAVIDRVVGLPTSVLMRIP